MGRNGIRLEVHLFARLWLGPFSYVLLALFCIFLDGIGCALLFTISLTRACCWRLVHGVVTSFAFMRLRCFPLLLSLVLFLSLLFCFAVFHFLGHISCIPHRVAELVFGLSVEAGLGGGSNCESRAAGWVLYFLISNKLHFR